MGFFIPHDNLKRLSEYKYASEDRSLMTKYFLKPFWQKFVHIFPLWMAPNVVTLSGLGFIIINLLTVFYYDPLLLSDCPSWCYYSYAVGLFLYQTFDACDGIHARRTGQSGPLGELFDHCVDAVNTTLSVIIFGSVTGLGYSWMLIIAQFSTLANFYLSTWEEFHTHKLFLSEFSGPVEGILGLIGLFTLTGYFGKELWTREIFELSGYSISLTVIFIFGGAIGLLFNIESARRNVANYYKDSKKENEAYKGILPFFIYYLTVFLWLIINPVIIENYLLPFVLTIGLTMAFSVGRIIVGHLTKQSFPVANPSSFIPISQIFLYYLLTSLHYSPISITSDLIWTGFGLSLGFYSMFIIEIIYEITTFLDIYTLSIKHPKKQD